jgi:hypothetical protein
VVAVAAEPQVPVPARPQPALVRGPRSGSAVSVPDEAPAVLVQGPVPAREQAQVREVGQPLAPVLAAQPARPAVDPARDLRHRRPTAAR